MVRLRMLILLFAMWVVVLFNIERYDILNINISSALYVAAGISLLPILLLPASRQVRIEFFVAPAIIIYLGMRYFGILSTRQIGLPAVVTEIVILLFTLWLGRKVSVNLSNVEMVVDEVVFDAKNTPVRSAVEGEDAIKKELFRARRYERPISLVYLDLPTIHQLQNGHPRQYQYQLSLEHRYISSRILRIVTSLVYQVDVITTYSDNLVICLPETNRQEAVRFARQIAQMVAASLNVNLLIGIATFPENGLIYADLVEAAKEDLTQYTGTDLTASKEQLPSPQDTPPVRNNNRLHDFPVRAYQQMKFIAREAVSLFLNDIMIIPNGMLSMKAACADRSHNDPDYWVNRIRHQYATSRWIYSRIKRLMDIAVVLLALPSLLIIFAVVSVAIWLEDRGPIFYSQYRIGLGGRKFRMYKFRSMVKNADQMLKEMGVHVNERNETVNEFNEKLEHDPRITRVGRIIRKTSLDELPQLWNVLMGHMSLVGPRPTSFGVDKYQLHHTQRLSVKPGMTGLWQILDRGNTDFDNRLIWDIKYIDRMSLEMDLQILLRTIGIIVRGRGAR